MQRSAALSADVELAETLASALPGFQRLHRALASAAASPSVPPSALAAWLGDLPSRLGGRAGSREAVARAIAGVALLEGEPGGGLGVQGTTDEYANLRQPGWAPPSWLFGPVWSLLYAMIAVAGWLVWRRVGFGPAS